LRAALRERARTERGFYARVAPHVGLSRQHLANFARGVYPINAPAAAMLREMLK
jgi:hypothetical protein